MKRFVRVVLIVALLGLLALWLLPVGEPEVPEGSVLATDLGGVYVEGPAPDLFARALGAQGRPLVAALSELSKAERDDRLAAVVVRLTPLDIGWAKAQELRAALLRLREAGRKVLVVLEIERFGANLEYFVASAADEIWLSPGTRAPIVGLASEYMFLGGMFEKLGVEIEVEKIGAYKNAPDSYAGTQMTDAHREVANAILDSIEGQFVTAIAEGRNLDPGKVREVVDRAPIEGHEMIAMGLADGIAFYDEVLDQVGGEVVEAEEYARVSAASVGFAPQAQLALIYGSGPVVTGRGSAGPGNQPVLASEAVVEALIDASEDPEIDGIVFRIDSPGGSALASDLVWRAVQRARAEKPVIASMSDLAASGGYYVAVGSDAIVAEAGTLTGSIGVFVLRPVVGELLDKLGIHTEILTRGRHAELLTGSKPLSPETRERLRAEITSVYTLFVDRVAKGRDLETAVVDGLARGRVWTGEQALERGLVDALGGLRTAVDVAREHLALDAETDVALLPYPPPKPLSVELQELLSGGVGIAPLVALTRTLPLPAGLERLATWLAPLPYGAPLLLPPFAVEIR